MIGLFLKFIMNTLALWFVVWLIPEISVDRFETLIVTSIILGLFNAFLRPLISSLTLPLEIFSLGIFTLIVNGFLFTLASQLVAGFHISSFTTAVGGALIFSIVSFILNLFIQPSGYFHFTRKEFRRGRPSEDDIIDIEGHVTKEDDHKKKHLTD